MGYPLHDICLLLQIFIHIFPLLFSSGFMVTHSFFVWFSFQLNANHNSIDAHTFTHRMCSNEVTSPFQIEMKTFIM